MTVHDRRILEIFEEISRIPRCSRNEEAIARWFETWAGAHGWPARRDGAGNLLVRVPASPGSERAPGVVIQGHLDMVCEKTPASRHDFSRDPIEIIYDGDWMRANETTLGADNGVALALGAAIAEDTALRRPPVELLFTVDEENGLTGAQKLKPGFVEGRVLLNLDSESDGVFTIGCAGGRDVQIQRPLRVAPLPAGACLSDLVIGGLSGGHSGIDIHRHRANAVKLMARALGSMMGTGEVHLVAAAGGTRRNAIPRDARARIACLAEHLPRLRRQADELGALFRAEFPLETTLQLALAEPEPPAGDIAAMVPEDAALAVNLLLALPHGACQMSPDFAELVMTSCNLAMTATTPAGLRIVTSQRGLTRSGRDAMSDQVRAAAALAGAQAHTESEYPPWTPNPASPLLARCRELYHGLFAAAPEVRAIHAGLECALIGHIYPGMDMISLGPTTENAHSPSERLHVPSLFRLTRFLEVLLSSLANG